MARFLQIQVSAQPHGCPRFEEAVGDVLWEDNCHLAVMAKSATRLVRQRGARRGAKSGRTYQPMLLNRGLTSV